MSNAKDIRAKIKSVKNTQKITKAMEMVAASKMRRAQDNMQQGRSYAQNILRVVNHMMASSKADFAETHYLLSEREEVRNVAYLLVTTDRGLCGGLNINLFKKLLDHMQEHQNQQRGVYFSVLGRKGIAFVNRMKGHIVHQKENYGDSPLLDDIIDGMKVLQELFRLGKVDRVYVVSNHFTNTMTQTPFVLQVLPAGSVNEKEMSTISGGASNHAEELPQHSWEYLYDAYRDVMLDGLITRYIESLVKQAVVENIACEMAARMIAMKSASDNAGSLISDLQLQYNKARQAAITQELSEIVGGAAAV
ncbi:MAG: F0F1 ATP synthase subunit gamma [Cardiobacteriaceae bacterium]|nr:F0F1 ATP synthase subunit gamma [Cardiobacteriaceae bacterium]